MAYRVVKGLGFRGLIGFVGLLGLVGKIAFGVYVYNMALVFWFGLRSERAQGFVCISGLQSW